MEIKYKKADGTLVPMKGEMNGDTLIVSDVEEKCAPKSGDIVTHKDGTIIIYKEMNGDKCGYHVYYKNGLHWPMAESHYYDYIDNVRPATEGERCMLFKALAEEDWGWDVKEQQFVRWMPEEGEEFYTITVNKQTGEFEADNAVYYHSLYGNSWGLYNKQLVFSDEKKCQRLCERLNQTVRCYMQ